MYTKTNNIFTNDADGEVGREWLTSALKHGSVEVEFEKKDGTMRVMKCTLDPSLLPVIVKSEEDPTKTHRPSSPSTLAVYDLEANAWRSFRWESVKSVTFS
jgi:hypothetical protein